MKRKPDQTFDSGELPSQQALFKTARPNESSRGPVPKDMPSRKLATHLDKEREALKQWDAQEGNFHMVQGRQRAALRMIQGRGGWLDLWVWVRVRCVLMDPFKHFFSVGDESVFGEQLLASALAHGPYATLSDDMLDDAQLTLLSVSVDEMLQLYVNMLAQSATESVKLLSGTGETIETLKKAIEWWKLMQIIVHDELSKRKLLDPQAKPAEFYLKAKQETLQMLTSFALEKTHAVAPSVVVDVHKLLKTKSSKDLVAMKGKVTRKLESGAPVDIEYWELLLKALNIFMARVKLKEMCKEISQEYVTWLRENHYNLIVDFESSLKTSPTAVKISKPKPAVAQVVSRPKLEKKSVKAFSNVPSAGAGFLYDDSLEAQKLWNEICDSKLERGEDSKMSIQDVDDTFSDVTKFLVSPTEKFKRCRPRFYNIVRQERNWNQYNNAHYSLDDPAPLLIRGYCFHIFYPHLPNSQTPSFKRLPDPHAKPHPSIANRPATEIVRFSAGPPYEDIAFRISYGDWDTSPRFGWYSAFEDGILRIFFLFQRERYKR